MRLRIHDGSVFLALCTLLCGGCGKDSSQEDDLLHGTLERNVLPSANVSASRIEHRPEVETAIEVDWTFGVSPVATEVRNWEAEHVEIMKGSSADGGVVWLQLKRMPRSKRTRLLKELEKEIYGEAPEAITPEREAAVERVAGEIGIGGFDRLIFINSRGDSPLPVFQEFRSTAGFGGLQGSSFTLPGPAKAGDEAAAEERYGHLFSIEQEPEQ